MNVLIGAILMALTAAGAAQDRPDLGGTWKLNPARTAQSDLRSTEDRAAIAGRRAPVGGTGPVGMGGGGRSPGGMGGGSSYGGENPDDVAKAREALRLAMLTPETLRILRDGAEFVVTDDRGASSRWKTDGKSVRSEVGALTIDTKAKWDGAVLVVERKFEGNVKSTDRYTVAGSPRQLTVTSKIETKLRGDRPRTIQRAYDLQ